MSHANPRASAKADSTIFGFSTGSGLGIIIAALVTGGLISLYTQNIGWPFMAVFALAALIVVTFINPKGLFLTVASIPFLYTLFMVLTGVLNQYLQLPEGQSSLARTQLALVVYPFVQYFPVLLIVSLGVLIIAVLRYWLLKRRNEEILQQEERQRRRAHESNERTSREATRSRQRTTGAQKTDRNEPREVSRRNERSVQRERIDNRAPKERSDKTLVLPVVDTETPVKPKRRPEPAERTVHSVRSVPAEAQAKPKKRLERPERAERAERAERPQRPERLERVPRPERRQRSESAKSSRDSDRKPRFQLPRRESGDKQSTQVTVEELLARRSEERRSSRRSVSRRLSNDLYGD